MAAGLFRRSIGGNLKVCSGIDRIDRSTPVRVYKDDIPYSVTAGDIEDAVNGRPVSSLMTSLIPVLREVWDEQQGWKP